MKFLTYFKFRILAASVLCAVLAFAPVAEAAPKKDNENVDNSDLNKDKVVDDDDLVIFSTRYLEMDWETVDWCAFWEATSDEGELYGRTTEYYRRHYSSEPLRFLFTRIPFSTLGRTVYHIFACLRQRILIFEPLKLAAKLTLRASHWQVAPLAGLP